MNFEYKDVVFNIVVLSASPMVDMVEPSLKCGLPLLLLTHSSCMYIVLFVKKIKSFNGVSIALFSNMFT